MSGSGVGIKEKAVAGVGWNGLGMVLRQASQFVATAVLARLLQPRDFGLIGMATIVTGLVISVREMGLSAAIIQRKDIEDVHLSSSFWASIASGLLLFGLCAAAAPLVARFFKSSIVAPILIALSAGLVISSVGAVHRACLLRDLKFKSIAVADVSISLGYALLAILMAALGFGVWSLVFGTLFGNAVGVALWWRGYRWRPSMTFSWSKFLDLLRFGASVMGSAIVGHLNNTVDYFIIGRRFGAFPLGIYTLAFKLISFPLTKISYMFTAVTFPAFSRFQEDDLKLRRGYTKTVRFLSLITFPLLAGLLVLAPQFVRVIYGPKWMPAVLPLRIMCVLGMQKAVGSTVWSVLRAKGRPDIELKFSASLLLGMILAVLLGSAYGIAGVALAITALALITFPIIQLITNRLIDLSAKEYTLSLSPALLGSVSMSLIIFCWKFGAETLVPGSNLFSLVSSCIIGAAVYWVILRLLRVEELRELPLLLMQLPGMSRLLRKGCEKGTASL